ncbi:MAG: hypothetical protein U0457_14050 [Candidatus Sericytochromatia bacterium]
MDKENLNEKKEVKPSFFDSKEMKALKKYQMLFYLLIFPIVVFSLVYWKTELLTFSIIAYLICFLGIYFNNTSKTIFHSMFLYLVVFFIIILLFLIFTYIVLSNSAGDIGKELLEVLFSLREK